MQARKSPTRLLLHTLVAPSMILACALTTSQADVYPGNSIIRVVVPTPPGPPPDIIARIIATELSETEGWRVVVDNRPGALQVTAMTDVLTRPADGLSIFPMSLGAIPTPALAPERAFACTPISPRSARSPPDIRSSSYLPRRQQLRCRSSWHCSRHNQGSSTIHRVDLERRPICWGRCSNCKPAHHLPLFSIHRTRND